MGSVSLQLGRGTILHGGYCRHHISFLQCGYTAFTQMSEISFISPSVRAPPKYSAMLLTKKNDRQLNKQGNHIKLSHEKNAVAWSCTHRESIKPTCQCSASKTKGTSPRLA
ncbi:hypothetical protein AVEN_99747-1 [Araneus ventricosus]|uniref:Uncharacterized protein n=1 Tax=Araneus ventricosus TaxID=182803 RepID=A0A4Y2DJ78_ARAVE|nr:hypothetical protein AVEN_99747-1 [Araneus ventricosus]